NTERSSELIAVRYSISIRSFLAFGSESPVRCHHSYARLCLSVKKSDFIGWRDDFHEWNRIVHKINRLKFRRGFAFETSVEVVFQSDLAAYQMGQNQMINLMFDNSPKAGTEKGQRSFHFVCFDLSKSI